MDMMYGLELESVLRYNIWESIRWAAYWIETRSSVLRDIDWGNYSDTKLGDQNETGLDAEQYCTVCVKSTIPKVYHRTQHVYLKFSANFRHAPNEKVV